jgi:predicted DNA-binding protein YlxM (UPF0122 family)
MRPIPKETKDGIIGLYESGEFTMDEIVAETGVSKGAVVNILKNTKRGATSLDNDRPPRHITDQKQEQNYSEHYFPEQTQPRFQSDPIITKLDNEIKIGKQILEIEIMRSELLNLRCCNSQNRPQTRTQPKPQPKKPNIPNTFFDEYVKAERQKILDKEIQRIKREILGDLPT